MTEEHQECLESERAEEFIRCLGKGRSIIEIEQEEDYGHRTRKLQQKG